MIIQAVFESRLNPTTANWYQVGEDSETTLTLEYKVTISLAK
jgi:hypothetical protein